MKINRVINILLEIQIAFPEAELYIEYYNERYDENSKIKANTIFIIEDDEGGKVVID